MDPSLYEVLSDTIIRLNVTCFSNTSSCLEFTANFTEMTPYNYTAPYTFNDTCYHGFATGERVPSVKVPAASPEGPSSPSTLASNITIILGGKADLGLPWSEGFNTDGEEKNDDFWAEWWGATHRRYGRRTSSSDDDDVSALFAQGNAFASIQISSFLDVELLVLFKYIYHTLRLFR